jgi:hypothetical protein
MQNSGYDQRILTVVAIVLAAAVFCITWYTIRASRADSFGLLVEQGRALTESLAEASQNAITSEEYYDRLVRQRYADLVITLMDMDVDKLSRQDWARRLPVCAGQWCGGRGHRAGRPGQPADERRGGGGFAFRGPGYPVRAYARRG